MLTAASAALGDGYAATGYAASTLSALAPYVLRIVASKPAAVTGLPR